PARGEVDTTGFLIDAYDAIHHPWAAGDLPLHLSTSGIEQIQVIVAVAFRAPDELAVLQLSQNAAARGVDDRISLLPEEDGDLAGCRVDGAHLLLGVAAIGNDCKRP